MPVAAVPTAEPADLPARGSSEPFAWVARDIKALAREAERHDLAERADEAIRRAGRTETIVCVVGEFKNGKSALINALIGSPVCPVDDDLATTAVTVVRYGDPARAEVHRRDGEDRTIEGIGLDALVDWVQESPGRERRRDVELVEVRVPSPLLATGLTLVDTPGVGGLNAGHAAATLAFLPSADALIFVTDASAELSASELEFLGSARSAGPPILVALTKIDMYPDWRRIRAIDEGRLAAMGLADPPFGLSSVVRLRPDEVDDESGYDAFTRVLRGDVVDRARAASLAEATADLRWVLGQLRDPLVAERVALADPTAARRLTDDLASARQRLADLKRGDAAWSARLDDEFGALRARIAFAFSGQMRTILREAQAEVEGTDPAGTWPDLSARVQDRIAATVRAAFRDASTGAGEIQATIAALLADEVPRGTEPAPAIAFDVEEFWAGDPEFESRTRSRLGTGYGAVTGAKAGVELLGLVGTLLGAAVVGPAVLGVAAIYGGKEVLDERRRRLTDRRQQARTFLADLVEEIRFQVDGRLTGVMDEMQRQMRARFTDRIAELHRTVSQSVVALEKAAKQEASTRRAREAEVAASIAALDAARGRLEEVGRSPGG
jgi:GTP-binding protein EngB required for normal cell division